ncbi:MAG: hypothetical protein LIR46_07825 [Bacteroidota bacterium]|nr:hypothetical protein [Bacteroidota bacterium]
MNKLYCFKLEENGEIKKITIDKWVERKQSEYTKRYTISFDNEKYPVSKTGKRYSLSSEKLERYVSKKLFTRNGDVKEAYRKIRKEIRERANKAKKIYDEAIGEYVKMTIYEAREKGN